MDLEDEEVIKQIYQSGIITDMETSKEYKKLLKRYNKFFDSIKAEKMKRKFEILEETKNKMYSEMDKDIFKLGFSLATKLIAEGLKNEKDKKATKK
ncbi:MAG: hypothetical protein HFJ20_07760 [Clostridia bacterium]|nr:hypothetical protein [Clostridia bacterium]